jgi:AcrR family transcriptional regulator
MRAYDGKTAEERVVERRERLLEAGLQLFAAQGFSGTSIRGVLREAGLQDRYFAESFSSLDALMAALVERVYEEEYAVCEAAIGQGGTREERVRAMLKALMRLLQEDSRKGRVKLVESLSAGSLTAACRQRGLLSLSGLVAGLLIPVPGSESTADPDLLAIAIVAGVNEMLLGWIGGTLDVQPDSIIEQGVLLCEALAQYSAPPPL